MNIKYLVNSITMIFLMAFSIHSFANDLCVSGQIYPIQEEDLLSYIQKRIQHMQQNGEWSKLQNQFRDRVAANAERPHPITNISKTTESKSWTYDASITVPYDLKDANGRVFAKAGTTVNPLTVISIHKALIFFDGDDTKQVAWAEKLNAKWIGKTKLVLVKGSIIDQEKNFLTQIYFDQEGRLTTRFHIQHVPAIVMQEGTHLKIMEVLP
jgi:conjugal transfer pilus assembly protein TraW